MARVTGKPVVIRSLRGTRMTITVNTTVRISLWLRIRMALAELLFRIGSWLVGIEVVKE